MGSLKPESSSPLGEFLILDDLITARAADEHQVPILGYPIPGKGVADFETFTGKCLDRFVDHAVKEYLKCGLVSGQTKVIALSGPSDLDYLVSLFALSRLGYTILLISPRLAPLAIANLLKMTNCDTILCPDLPALISNISQAKKEVDILQMIPMARRSLYDRPEVSAELRFSRSIDKHEERKKLAIICHSSGSTGFPKPIFQPHNRFMATIPAKAGGCDFSIFPLYHSWGNKACFNTMWARKIIYLHSTTAPMTTDGLVEVLEKVKPSTFHAVPYGLKLLAESKAGVEALARCEEVIYSGSPCPDSLGDYLTDQGVRLVTLFGATEFGTFGSSRSRPADDKSWNYIRMMPFVKPYVEMRPIGDNTYESIFLPSEQLVASNSDDPVPGSYHSKDIFSAHPTIPDAWKYLGRLDDRITLINGEKVLPIPIEGRVKNEPLVREAIVFGIEKSIPGILIIRAEAARHMADDEFIDAIWPAVQDANLNAEAFSQISKEMILPLPAGTEYPITDKGSIIRAQVYRNFADQLEEVYRNFENTEQGSLELEGPELESFLMKIFTNDLGLELSSPSADFFAAGMDSLQSIQARGVILKNISMGGNGGKLGQNIVFESGNVSQLAKRLQAIRKGEEVEKDDTLDAMRNAVQKYSELESRTPGTATSEKSVVVLTGATGSLGAHILAKLLAREDVGKVYCLTRGSEPSTRVIKSLTERGLKEVSSDPRIITLTSELHSPDLALDATTLQILKEETTHIIHAAWAVNFNVRFQAFERDIIGVHNLLRLSLSVQSPHPARFFFCSSVGVAMGAPRPAIIPEALVDISLCSPGGYGRSKWVAENIISNATAKYGADAHILRIGQIVGDAKLGIWNDSEAIPLVIRSQLTLKTLPTLDMICTWLPVDTLASSILDLTFHPRPKTIYNLRSPNSFSWTQGLLPQLASHGLEFQAVPVYDWLAQLKNASMQSNVEEKNPAVKLLEYYERSYGGRGYGEESESGDVSFAIEGSLRDSVALRGAPDLLREGYVGRFLESWMGKWKGGL